MIIKVGVFKLPSGSTEFKSGELLGSGQYKLLYDEDEFGQQDQINTIIKLVSI